LSGEPDTLFGRLVHDGALLRFRSDPRIITSDDEEETLATASSASSLEPVISSRDILQTHVTEDTLQKRLLKFARDAKTLEEEQGINILYLAIGFLRWYEDDKSEVFREAPLILIPVSLVRDVRRSTFDLRGREEDISTNLPLAERLKDDFGITLPEVPDEDSWIPATYFGSVEGAVRNKPRWSIDRTAVELGFFSFAKLLMFHDLAGNAWPEDAILEHPLLRGLLMEGFESEIPLFPDDVKIDETFEPAELIQVVDADGSQTLSIEAVRAGRNLVIQGPPGTGKSQTIANIIASAVHDGKTVLFIAEKMVALEVVHARLAKAGLNTICLELHSRAANKRVVAEELGRTLSMGAAEPNLTKDAERLKLVRDQLNAFCRQLHSPIGETDMTPYKALGDLVSAAGRGLPPPEIRITGLETWDSGAYQRVENAVERLAVIFQRLGTKQAYPWTGTRNLNLQPPDLARLQDRLTKLRKVFQELAQLSASSATVIAQPAPATLASVRHLIELLDEVKSAPTANADAIRWLAGLGGYERQRALHIAEEGVVTQGVIKKSEGLFQPAALRADVASVRSSLARGVRSWFIRLLPNYRRATAELSAWLAGPLPAAASERVQIVELLANLQERVRILSNYAAEAESLLGPAWAAHRSDFHGIMLAGEWLERVTIRARKLDLNQALAWGARGEMAALLPKRLRNDFEAADVGLAALVEVLDLDVTSAFGVSAIETVPFDTLVERLAIWNGAIDRYNEWGELSRADAEIRDRGAGDLADHLADGRSSPDQAAAQLRYARAEALWKISIRRDPALAHPTGEARSTLVREFRQLETERRQAIAQLIRARHVSAIPRGAMGAMAVVRGEIARKRGHMPIRKLMQRAGRTIQSIKPVFMMSPISVAQYLPPGALTFDMVVIDEASQVRPEDALGVIARGTQIVVVGDRKQLPPTSFFSRLLADDEAEDDENPAAEVSQLAGAARVTELESILTLCEARGLPSRMLRWHYRSRHPSLVEVSNAEFYESSLFLPPAPVAHRDTEGLVVRRTHGAYDRGGKRTNPIEAKAVVDAVAAHAARQPKLSLGVATFRVFNAI